MTTCKLGVVHSSKDQWCYVTCWRGSSCLLSAHGHRSVRSALVPILRNTVELVTEWRCSCVGFPVEQPYMCQVRVICRHRHSGSHD